MNVTFVPRTMTIKLYFIGLWIWIKAWFVIPRIYLCAVYCCAMELYMDFFCDKPLRNRFEEWAKSSLLRECSQEKRIVVMTGADGTIGTEISRFLLQFGFEVVIFGLRRPRLSLLKDWDHLHLFKCDLLIPNQVHLAINEFQRKFDHVDLFIFNAGVMLHPRPKKPNAVDPHFNVNLLSHALIFDALRTYMEKSPRSSPKVIALSSATAQIGDLQRFIYGDPSRAFRQYRNGYKSYADSKLYVSLYIRELATLLRGTKIKCVSLHPGVVAGSLYRFVFHPIRFVINNVLKFIIRNDRRAAIEVLNLAFDDTIRSGCYYEHFYANDFNKDYSDIQLRRLYEAVQYEIR